MGLLSIADGNKDENENMMGFLSTKIKQNKQISNETQHMIEKHYYKFKDTTLKRTQEKKRHILDTIILFTKEKLIQITQNEEDQKKHKFSMMHKIKGKMSSLMFNDKNLTILGQTDLKAQLNREKVKFNGSNSRAFQFVDRQKIYELIQVAYAWILADYGIVFCADLHKMFKNVKNVVLNDEALGQCRELEERKKSFLQKRDFFMGFEENWKFAGEKIIKKITTSGLITFLFGDNDNTTGGVFNFFNFLNPTISNYVGDYSKSNTQYTWQMKINKGGKMPFKIKEFANNKGALKNGCISSFFHLMDNYRQNLNKKDEDLDLENHHVGLMLLSNFFLGPLSATNSELALTHGTEATSMFVQQFQTIQRLMIESFDALVLRDAYDFSEIFENYDNALNYFQQISLKEESDGWGNWLWWKKGKDFELPDDFKLKLSGKVDKFEDKETIKRSIEKSLVGDEKNIESKNNNNSFFFTYDIPIKTTNNLVTFHKNFKKQNNLDSIKDLRFFFSDPFQIRSIIEKLLYENNRLNTEAKNAFFASTVAMFYEYQMNKHFLKFSAWIVGLGSQFQTLLDSVQQTYNTNSSLVLAGGVMVLAYQFWSTTTFYSARKAVLMEKTINRENGKNMYMSGGLSRLGFKFTNPGEFLYNFLRSSNKGNTKKAITVLIAFQSLGTLIGKSIQFGSVVKTLYDFSFGQAFNWFFSLEGLTALGYLYFEYSDILYSDEKKTYGMTDKLFKKDIIQTFFAQQVAKGYVFSGVLNAATYSLQVLVPILQLVLNYIVQKFAISATQGVAVTTTLASFIVSQLGTTSGWLLEKLGELFDQQTTAIKAWLANGDLKPAEMEVSREFFLRSPKRILCEDTDTYQAQSLLTQINEMNQKTNSQVKNELPKAGKPVNFNKYPEFSEFEQLKTITQELKEMNKTNPENPTIQKCFNMFTQIYDCVTFKNWDREEKSITNLNANEGQCDRETNLFLFSNSGYEPSDPEKRADIAKEIQMCMGKVTTFTFKENEAYKAFKNQCETKYPELEQNSVYDKISEVSGYATKFFDSDRTVLVGAFVIQSVIEMYADNDLLKHFNIIQEMEKNLKLKEERPDDILTNLISSEPEIACPKENEGEMKGIYVRATARSLQYIDLPSWDQRKYVGWSNHWQQLIQKYREDPKKRKTYAEPLGMFIEDNDREIQYMIDTDKENKLDLEKTFLEKGNEISQSGNKLNPSHFLLYKDVNSSSLDMYLRAPWRTCDSVVPQKKPDQAKTNSTEQKTSSGNTSGWIFGN